MQCRHPPRGKLGTGKTPSFVALAKRLSMSLHPISRDHHYVPRFYLKGFCRRDGTFDVYDKQYQKFKKLPQSPGTAFFERDRNNVVFRGARSDFIEKAYAGIESSLGDLFNLIRAGATREVLLQPQGIHLLKLHLSIQFWRLPRMDEFSERFLLSRTPAQVEHICAIVAPAMPRQGVYDLIQSDKGFRHYFRSFWLPLSTFDLSDRTPPGMSWTLLDVEDPARWSNHLCSDSPFVFLNPDGQHAFDGPFVFPLSGSRLLLSRSSSNTATSFDPSLSVRLSILLFFQATRFVAAANRSYIKKLIELSHAYVGTDGRHRLDAEVMEFLR